MRKAGGGGGGGGDRGEAGVVVNASVCKKAVPQVHMTKARQFTKEKRAVLSLSTLGR